MHIQATKCVCPLFFLVCTQTIAYFTQKQLSFFFKSPYILALIPCQCRKSSPFPLTASEYSTVGTAHTLCAQATTDGQAGRFQLDAITHNSALNHLAHVSFCPCEHMSEVGWLDERVCAFVSLINIAKLPFLEVIPSGA